VLIRFLSNTIPSTDNMATKTVLVEETLVWGNLSLKAGCISHGFPITHAWPTQLDGPLVWGPDTFGSEDDYTITLTETEIAEVRNGMKHFKSEFHLTVQVSTQIPDAGTALGLYGSDVSPETFPLPTLGPKLRRMALDIHSGRGFAVVRGLDPDEFSQEDNVLIFLGISSYIAELRGRQDENGSMLSMHLPLRYYYSPCVHASNVRDSAHPQLNRLQDPSTRPSNPLQLPSFSQSPPLETPL
jgi:hypothetical protein